MKKIAYVTGSRAEYGIVKRLLKKIQMLNNVELSLIVTAMHLSKEYGETVSVIENDGIDISHRIPLNIDVSNNAGVISTMGECLSKFGAHFQDYDYDAVMLLGDRYEIFAAATAASMHNIPIIHLHGGEQTLGNYDEFIRHSITKMSRLHLTSTEVYQDRVVQLGEAPHTVFNVGSLGAENTINLILPKKEELEYCYIAPQSSYFVVVFHPETLSHQSVSYQVDELLKALDFYREKYSFVFIGSNSDTHSDILVKEIKEYANKYSYNFFTSLKPEEYLALIKYSQGIIGNSSSGLLEAPSLKVGTLKIGSRQQGRVRGESVIDVDVDTSSIISGIELMISPHFMERLSSSINPYYQDNCLDNICDIITAFLKQNHSAPKEFFDICR